MRVIREIVLGQRKVLVKELTLEEIRAWLAESAGRVMVDVVDEVFSDRDLLVGDLPYFTDLSTTDLDGLAPSEIAPVVDLIREVNSLFFAIWQRRLAAARQAMAAAPTSLPAALPD